MEPLESRQLLTAAPIMAATINLDRHFGHHGYATATLPWHDGRAIFMDDLEATADGKIYAAATMDTPSGLTNDIVVGRFNSNGQPDQTFANHGVLVTTIDGGFALTTRLRVQHNGRLLVIVASDQGGIEFLRFRPNGTPDFSFGHRGRVAISQQPVPGYNYSSASTSISFADYRPSIWLQRDGRIVTLYQRDEGLLVLRLNQDGSPDLSLGPGGEKLILGIPGINTRDPWLRMRADYFGSIVAATLFPNPVVYYALDRNARPHIGYSTELIQVRLDANWNVVSTKVLLRTKPDLSGFGGLALAWQPDGRLLVVSHGRMLRLNVDGTPDIAFGMNPFAEAPLYDRRILVQADGKILVVRDSYYATNGVQRLNADGSPDRNFAGGQMAFGFAHGISFGNEPLALPDGSIVFGATFYGPYFADTGMLELIKIRPSGGKPNTFDLKAHGVTPFVIPQSVNTGFDSYATRDPNVIFGLPPGYGVNPFAPGAHALFSGVPLTSVWNPTDRRNLLST